MYLASWWVRRVEASPALWLLTFFSRTWRKALVSKTAKGQAGCSLSPFWTISSRPGFVTAAAYFCNSGDHSHWGPLLQSSRQCHTPGTEIHLCPASTVGNFTLSRVRQFFHKWQFPTLKNIVAFLLWASIATYSEDYIFTPSCFYLWLYDYILACGNERRCVTSSWRPILLPILLCRTIPVVEK